VSWSESRSSYCPIRRSSDSGKTFRQWRQAFLAYFTTGRSSDGGTGAINGLIELHRRIARGFRNRDSYRLRTLLIGGGLTPHLSRESLKSTQRGNVLPP
jgi:transposase